MVYKDRRIAIATIEIQQQSRKLIAKHSRNLITFISTSPPHLQLVVSMVTLGKILPQKTYDELNCEG